MATENKIADLYVEISAKTDKLEKDLKSLRELVNNKKPKVELDTSLGKMKLDELKAYHKSLKSVLEKKISMKMDVSSLQQTQAQIKQVEKAIRSTGETVKTSFIGNLKNAAIQVALLTGAYQVLKGVITSAISEASAQETAENKLSNALGFTSEKLLKKAGEIQRVTKYSDDMVLSAYATIAAFTNEEDVIDSLTKSAMDFASATGTDLNTASEMLIKTLNGGRNVLKSYGIEIEGAAGSSERLQNITESVASLWGGRAQSEANTFSGKMEIMKNKLNEVYESIGFALLPTLEKLSGAIGTGADELNKSNKTFEDISTVIKGVSFVIIALVGAIVTLGKYWGAVFGSMLVTAYEFAGGIGDIFSGDFGNIGNRIKRIGKTISDGFGGAYDSAANTIGLMSSLFDKSPVASAIEKENSAINKAIAERISTLEKLRNSFKEGSAEYKRFQKEIDALPKSKKVTLKTDEDELKKQLALTKANADAKRLINQELTKDIEDEFDKQLSAAKNSYDADLESFKDKIKDQQDASALYSEYEIARTQTLSDQIFEIEKNRAEKTAQLRTDEITNEYNVNKLRLQIKGGSEKALFNLEMKYIEDKANAQIKAYETAFSNVKKLSDSEISSIKGVIDTFKDIKINIEKTSTEKTSTENTVTNKVDTKYEAEKKSYQELISLVEDGMRKEQEMLKLNTQLRLTEYNANIIDDYYNKVKFADKNYYAYKQKQIEDIFKKQKEAAETEKELDIKTAEDIFKLKNGFVKANSVEALKLQEELNAAKLEAEKKYQESVTAIESSKTSSKQDLDIEKNFGNDTPESNYEKRLIEIQNEVDAFINAGNTEVAAAELKYDLMRELDEEYYQEKLQRYLQDNEIVAAGIDALYTGWSNAFSMILDEQMTGSEKWAAIWDSMSNYAIQALGDILAQYITTLIAEQVFGNTVKATEIATSIATGAAIAAAYAPAAAFASIASFGGAAVAGGTALAGTVALAQSLAIPKFSKGGEFIVPQGYENDTFPMLVESGERVSITPKTQVKSETSFNDNRIVDALYAVNKNISNLDRRVTSIDIDGRNLAKIVLSNVNDLNRAGHDLTLV